MAGLEACEGLLTHQTTKNVVAERYLARRFLSSQQAVERGDLDNA